MQRRHLLKLGTTAIATAALPLGLTQSAFAQSAFPSRPLRLVVGFPAGGPTDVFARQYAQRLGTVLGQPVVVENKSGASGAIGALEVKGAPPDGHVLFFGTATTHGLYNLMSAKPQYDSMKDFSHVAVVGGAPGIFAVHPSMPATLKGFVEQARANPGKLQYGSPGQGTYLHLMGERMKKEAGGVEIQHIPYRGGAQAVPALIGGQIAMSVDTLSSLLQHHKSGKVRIVAIGTSTRSAVAPDVPTVDEALGTRGFEALLWNVVTGPAGMPANVMAALSAANLKVMADAAFQEQLAGMGIVSITNSNPVAAVAYIRSETEKWRPVVESSGIKSE